MSTMLCTECGKTFEGEDQNEVADALFEHMKEHAEEEKQPENIHQDEDKRPLA